MPAGIHGRISRHTVPAEAFTCCRGVKPASLSRFSAWSCIVSGGGVMRRTGILAALAMALSIIGVAAAPNAEAAESSKVVRYGPFTIPAGASASDPAMLEQLKFAVARPCGDCFITGFTPDLVYPDGSRANMDTGPMLHHVVYTSQFRPDATCRGTVLGLAGERFFASGNERTGIAFPAGYGYRVRWYDSWNMLVDLMNHSTESKTVYVQVTYRYRPSWESVQPVRPVWLDIDQCGDSQYSIPAGYSDTHWDWNVNVPGDVVAAIGHVHGHGVAVEATNENRGGKSICRSEATLDPNDVHSVLAMSTCVGTPLDRLRSGDLVRLHSIYQSSHPANDVMGIMLMYVRPR
jgi:hypothetical protein